MTNLLYNSLKVTDPIEEIGRRQICEQVGTESDTFGGHFGSYRHCWEAVRVTIKTNAVHPKRKGLYWTETKP